MRKHLILTFIALFSTFAYADSSYNFRNFYGNKKKSTYSPNTAIPRSYSRRASANTGFYLESGVSILPRGFLPNQKGKQSGDTGSSRARSKSRGRSSSQSAPPSASRSRSRAANSKKGAHISARAQARNLAIRQNSNERLKRDDGFLLAFPIERKGTKPEYKKVTLRLNPAIMIDFLKGGYQFNKKFAIEGKLPIFFDTKYDSEAKHHRETVYKEYSSVVPTSNEINNVLIRYDIMGAIPSLMLKWTIPLQELTKSPVARSWTGIVKGGGMMPMVRVKERLEIKGNSIADQKTKLKDKDMNRHAVRDPYSAKLYCLSAELGLLYRPHDKFSVEVLANIIYPISGSNQKRKEPNSSDYSLSFSPQIKAYYKLV